MIDELQELVQNAPEEASEEVLAQWSMLLQEIKYYVQCAQQQEDVWLEIADQLNREASVIQSHARDINDGQI